jgi:membrane associated rhomboid family serine protease
MNHHTDRQLALTWIRKLKGFTTVFVVFMAIVSLSINNQGLFSAEFGDPIIHHLSFDLRSPFRDFGIAFLTSVFVHFNFSHFFSNSIWLLLFGLILERTRGVKILLLTGLTGHLISLLFSYWNFSPDKPHYVLGASAFTLSVIGFTAMVEKKLFLYMLSGIILVFLASSSHDQGSHLVAFGMGLLLGHFFDKQIKKKSKS